MDETAAISKEENQLQENHPAEVGLRNQLYTIIWIGLAISIFISVLLMLFFAKSITQRLAILINNNERFAQHKSLLAPVSGDDEIADLDQNFHDMVKKLAQAEERKKLYAQMISHDLRAPLAAIQGTLAVALKGIYGELNEKGKKRIGAAESDSDRLINLINEMLDLDSLNDGHIELDRQDCTLEEIMDAALNSVTQLAETKQIVLDSKIYYEKGGSQVPTQIAVSADKERLKRVLINLLHNSIKFSPPSQTIEINTAVSPELVRIMIKDRGPGIKTEEAAKLFQPFQQGESGKNIQEAGTGLGLAICKAIVEAHGGEIGVESKVGFGSIFWFTIPLK